MHLLDLGSIVAALSLAEWFVWAAIAVLFGKQALVFATANRRSVLRLSAIASVAFVAALATFQKWSE